MYFPLPFLPVDFYPWVFWPGFVASGASWVGRDAEDAVFYAGSAEALDARNVGEVDLRVFNEAESIALHVGVGQTLTMDLSGVTWFGQRVSTGLRLHVEIDAEGNLVLPQPRPGRLVARVGKDNAVLVSVTLQVLPGQQWPTGLEILAGDGQEEWVVVERLAGPIEAWGERQTVLTLSDRPAYLAARCVFDSQSGVLTPAVRLNWPATPAAPSLMGEVQ